MVAVIGKHRGKPSARVVDCRAVSADGALLALAGDDDRISLWDMATMCELASIATERRHSAVGFTPDGMSLVSFSDGGVFRAWDIRNPARPLPMRQLDDWYIVMNYREVLFCKKKLTETGSTDVENPMVHVIDPSLPQAKTIYQFAGTAIGYAACIALSRDESRLAIGDSDGKVHVWDISGDEPQSLDVVPTRNNSTGTLAFDDRGEYLACGGDNWLNVWRCAEYPIELQFEQYGGVETVRFRPGSKTLLIVGGDDQIASWKPGQSKPKPGRYLASDKEINYWTSSEDCQRVVAVSPRNSYGIRAVEWDGDSPELKEAGAPLDWSHLKLISLNERRLVAIGDVSDGFARRINIWELQDREGVVRFEPRRIKHEGYVMAAAQTGDYLATFSSGKYSDQCLLTVWRMHEGSVDEIASRMFKSKADHLALGVSSNGTKVAVSTDRQGTQLWKVDEDALVQLHDRTLLSLTFSPDGRLLTATGPYSSPPNLLALWHVANDVPVEIARYEQGDWSWKAAFSADSQRMISVGRRGARLWRVGGEKPSAHMDFEEPAAAADCAALSADNTLLAISYREHGVVLWDLEKRQRRTTWKLAGMVLGLAFAPDSRHLALQNFNGTIYIVRCPT